MDDPYKMTNNNPLISIAMATYNGGLYIANQLNSIIGQTYKNIEIIIVDDCSGDDTINIISDYQKLHSNIRLIKNPSNQGAVKTFAHAMSLCRGDFIALADQDDIWFSDKLERLLDNIGDNLLIHSDAILVDNNMQPLAISNMANTNKDMHKTEFIDYLISPNVTGCTTLFPRKLVDLALPIPDRFYIHDHYLALIASFYGRVKYLDEPLVYYRQHGKNSIGAGRFSFDKFVNNCKSVADSYTALLSMPAFKNNYYIELLRDYRLSVYLSKWTSRFSLFRLLCIKHGVKLLAYYILIGGVLGRNFARRAYNYIYKT
ncbi:MAG: glycosyltransferase family 2 protein [Burkholderiales bacterium]|jgi:glycosyltransferase involved in cell wall biosynthesis|nr:glycosyltransferase family 2 protein [Burkholderiales bacterium]